MTIDLEQLERDREDACVDKVDLFDFYNSRWDSLVDEVRKLRSGIALPPTKVWVMTEIWDDSDPGDKASLSKVRVFTSLEGARSAFLEKHGDLKVDAAIDDLEIDFGDDIDEEVGSSEWLEEVHRACRMEPERYVWTDSEHGDGWNGGYIVEITEMTVKP